jgi:transposase-like protein
VKVAGRWTYLDRAVDQHGQVIDVLVCEGRDACAARAFFARALTQGPSPVEVTIDRAPVYPRVIDRLAPSARQVIERYATDESVNGGAASCAWSWPISLPGVAAGDRQPRSRWSARLDERP